MHVTSSGFRYIWSIYFTQDLKQIPTNLEAFWKKILSLRERTIAAVSVVASIGNPLPIDLPYSCNAVGGACELA